LFYSEASDRAAASRRNAGATDRRIALLRGAGSGRRIALRIHVHIATEIGEICGLEHRQMLTESARVIRRDGDRVELELQRVSACDNCELGQGCGTGALGRLLGRRSRPLVIETDQDCHAGDRVMLALPESALVRASLLLYGLPLLGLLLGGLVAMLFALAEWLVVAAAGLGLFAGCKVAAHAAKRIELSGQAPYIRQISVNPAPEILS